MVIGSVHRLIHRPVIGSVVAGTTIQAGRTGSVVGGYVHRSVHIQVVSSVVATDGERLILAWHTILQWSESTVHLA